MLPFKLRSAYKDYLWGGTRLRDEYNKKCDMDKIAESWELSAHKDGMCYISSGELTGMSFLEFTEKYRDMLGTDYEDKEEFPILIKFIDALKPLSIQVHPNDEYARRVENSQGKTEMWCVLDCSKDAFLYFGFENEISREELKKRVENGTLLEVLRRVEVKKDDVFFIKAGTIHAIGAGIVIAEIQQNSNMTYRVYDYDRVDGNGNKRELHIDKARDVIEPVRANIYVADENMHIETSVYKRKNLAKCKYFEVDRISLDGEIFIEGNERSFYSYLCIDGSTVMKNGKEEFLEINKGDGIFVPSKSPRISIKGKAEFITARL